MTQHLYTQEEISNFVTLALEAQAIESSARVALTQADQIITSIIGHKYIGWECDYTDMLGTLIDATRQQFQVAPYQNWMPKVGQFTVKPQRADEWQKLNNRARREVEKLRKAIAAHA